MSARKLTEGAVTLLVDYIRANIGTALAAVSAQNNLPYVTLEDPKSYFIYAKPQGYSLPAIFVICDDMDFRISDRKSNFINASDKINVSVVVEDQDEDRLTYKTWRYQSALHSVLDESTIVSSDQKLLIKPVVYHDKFSEIYMDTKGPSQGGRFRKEVVLMCEVEHLENF